MLLMRAAANDGLWRNTSAGINTYLTRCYHRCIGEVSAGCRTTQVNLKAGIAEGWLRWGKFYHDNLVEIWLSFFESVMAQAVRQTQLIRISGPVHVSQAATWRV